MVMFQSHLVLKKKKIYSISAQLTSNDYCFRIFLPLAIDPIIKSSFTLVKFTMRKHDTNSTYFQSD